MRVLNPRVDPEAFFGSLAHARARVLMLDYDGTLAPFAVRPERAFPYPEAGAEIERILEEGTTRVVIVSGRRLEDLVPLLPWRRRPELWGAHGWERMLPDGRTLRREPEARAREALARAEGIARELAREGARIETKPASVALHWRGLPVLVAAKVRESARRQWEPLTGDAALELLDFECGLELRATGCSKGEAVRTVLEESARPAAAAYLGDDLTDEDAFAAVQPEGLAVLVRGELRETRADVWIRPPQELLVFLRRWRESARETRRDAARA